MTVVIYLNFEGGVWIYLQFEFIGAFLFSRHRAHSAYTDHPSPVSGEDYYDYIEAQLEDEGDPDNLGACYGLTPPHPRALKREKERQANATRGSYVKRSYKDQKENIAKRKNQPRAVLNVIKDAHSGDPTLCKLTGFDSDDNIDVETFREKKEKRKRDSRECKKQTKSRDHDRFMKRMSDDFSGLDVGSMAQVPVKLESSGRFSHLMTKPVLAISPASRTRRQWTEPRECPADRKNFSDTFCMLIKLGTQAKKDKERKLASTKRQMSSEVEQWKSQLMDFMWIELNAYLHGCSPEEEQATLRVKRDEVVKVLDDIINFQFRHHDASQTPSDSALSAESDIPMCYSEAVSGVTVSPTTHDDISVSQTTSSGGASQDGLINSSNTSNGQTTPRESSVIASRGEADNIVSVQLDDGVSASFHDVILTANMVQLQQEALLQVQKLVDRLDACEALYPTMRQIAIEYPLYGDPSFTRRVESLNLWLNITCDLCHKLKLFGRIIGAEQYGIGWPIVNFDFPFPRQCEHYRRQRTSVPNIRENYGTSGSDVEEDVDNEEEEDDDDSVVEAGRGRGDGDLLCPSKQVKFTFGSDSATSSRDTSPNQRGLSTLSVEPSSPVDSSTPNRNSRSSMGSFATLSRASSDISLDGVSELLRVPDIVTVVSVILIATRFALLQYSLHWFLCFLGCSGPKVGLWDGMRNADICKKN